MSGFNTKERNNNGEYEVTFYTDNYADFKTVENLCRKLIGHEKPGPCKECQAFDCWGYTQTKERND